jgi:hypothetical protein
MTRRVAERLAAKLGCTLKYQRTGSTKHVTIYLPEGSAWDDNHGLDVLHHECELDEDIWSGVVADLKVFEI